jgi:copper homeostasis protein
MSEYWLHSVSSSVVVCPIRWQGQVVGLVRSTRRDVRFAERETSEPPISASDVPSQQQDSMPLEIACFNVESALIAAKAGADRIELCAGASVGGTTPSLRDLQTVKANVTIPVNVMIRPRGGNFVYSDEELDQMKVEIKQFTALADGFVFGVLNTNNKVDMKGNREFVQLAGGKPCTFHRAFDEITDLAAAAEDVVQCGFAAILTSGGHPNAVAGASAVAEVVESTQGRLDIITGGGVRSGNVEKLRTITNGRWFHSSAITDTAMEMASSDEVQALREKLEHL